MMVDLMLPRIENIKIQGNTASYAIEPLATGGGITIGNPLRRVLLSSLPGAAVTSLRIEGVQHEFQDIPNVMEDVTEIVLNVKQLRLRCLSDHPVPLRLDVSGEHEITGADLAAIAPATIEIANPELHIATLDNERAHLVMELVVETGRGYVPAIVDTKQDIGIISLDALYSPVRKVNFKVERMSLHDNHALIEGERLIVEIETDGTMTPDEALRHSADILVTHYALIGAYDPEPIPEPGPAPVRIPIPQEFYQLALEELHVSRRIFNALKRRISTVGQLLELEEDDLHSIRNFGNKGLQEITEALWAGNFLPCLPCNVEASSSSFMLDEQSHRERE